MTPIEKPPPGYAYISATLKGATARMSPHERHKARECFEHYRGEFQRIAPEASERVAYTVHLMVDEQMQRLARTKNGRDVRCRKGCAACCHLSVDVFTHEAELLWQFVKHEGLRVDEAKLARQAAAADDAAWSALPAEDQRCVFLGDDNACKVYEHRPGACRKYTVKTDPELCDMHKHPGGKVGIVFSHEAEIAHSAAMTVYGSGLMAAMLLATRGLKE